MKANLFINSVVFSGFVIFGTVGAASAQTPEPASAQKVNFGYSQNPKTRAKKENSNQNTTPATENSAAQNRVVEEQNPRRESIAQKTLEVVKNASKKSLAPTEIYRVGTGDILFINLQNSSKGSTLFTVLEDGTIDYPLAGAMIQVSGLTTDEIEEILRERVTLFENPEISVRVREYASHKITVLGMVEKTGDRFIQREAVPLFVVRAEAMVQNGAERVVIRRSDASVETYSLSDEKSENALVFPNDIVEFTGTSPNAKISTAGFFFIGGGVAAGGQKDYSDGMTLTQAILASGGLRKDGIKKVVIRRKNAEGLLVSTDYNLKSIKDGKVPDPEIRAGDTIEVGN